MNNIIKPPIYFIMTTENKNQDQMYQRTILRFILSPPHKHGPNLHRRAKPWIGINVSAGSTRKAAHIIWWNLLTTAPELSLKCSFTVRVCPNSRTSKIMRNRLNPVTQFVAHALSDTPQKYIHIYPPPTHRII